MSEAEVTKLEAEQTAGAEEKPKIDVVTLNRKQIEVQLKEAIRRAVQLEQAMQNLVEQMEQLQQQRTQIREQMSFIQGQIEVLNALFPDQEEAAQVRQRLYQEVLDEMKREREVEG